MNDKIQNLLTACFIGVLSALSVWGASMLFPQVVQSWEWEINDARFQWRGETEVSPHLVVIGRDADSDARFGIGLWDRSRFARMVQALADAGAATIVVDFHFAGPSPSDRGGQKSDEALVEASARAGNTVFPLLVTLQEGRPRPVGRTMPDGALPIVTSMSGPLPALAASAHAVGHIASVSDADGSYRRVPLMVNSQGRAVAALGLSAAAAFLRLPVEQVEVILGKEVFLRDGMWPDGIRRTIALPVDDQGNMLINYAGKWTDGRFPYFSFVDVSDAIEEGRTEELRAQVAGKIVLLMHAGLEADKRRTPLELKAPGGFIHANVINTILTRRGLRETSPGVWASLVGLLAAGSATLLLRYPSLTGIGLVVAVLASYVCISQILFAVGGLIAPTIGPIAAVALASGGSLAWSNRVVRQKMRSLEEETRMVRQTLSASHEVMAREETRLERLEEDLLVAQEEALASGEQKQQWLQDEARLNAELSIALEQVENTRRNVSALEDRLARLTTAVIKQEPLSDEGWEQLRRECEQLGVLTQDRTMLRMFRDLKKAAPSRRPILFLGETGTGKELFARAAHVLSAQKTAPFVAVNMAAISPDVVESELFGHIKGAFTGADRDRKGYFEQADSGTIFLDEIGDLRPDVQAKLLRVLQEGTFYRVGAMEPRRVNVRVVAATNKDLVQGLQKGWFREDLYFRLRGIELRLPPLRDRKGDIPLLSARFVRGTAAQLGREDATLSNSALEAIERWPWPGNIRELKQRLEQAVILADSTLITEHDLRLEQLPVSASAENKQEAIVDFDMSGDGAVLAQLRAHAFDMQATAQELRVDRSTVTQRLKGMCFHVLVKHDGNIQMAAFALAGEHALAHIVMVKLEDYYSHLTEVARSHTSVEDALALCRKRYKNIPERYLPAVESLVRQIFRERSFAQNHPPKRRVG